MNKELKIVTVVSLLLWMSCYTNQDSLALTRKGFKEKVEQANQLMESQHSINLTEAIDMVRMLNTIVNDSTVRKIEPYLQFKRLFIGEYSEKAAMLIGALPTKGMAYYSRKYDLYIGGPVHENSHYKIIE